MLGIDSGFSIESPGSNPLELGKSELRMNGALL